MCVCVCVYVQETCHQYWPSSGSLTVGEFTVELIQEERLSGFTLRNLSIVNNKVRTCKTAELCSGKKSPRRKNMLLEI